MSTFELIGPNFGSFVSRLLWIYANICKRILITGLWVYASTSNHSLISFDSCSSFLWGIKYIWRVRITVLVNYGAQGGVEVNGQFGSDCVQVVWGWRGVQAPIEHSVGSWNVIYRYLLVAVVFEKGADMCLSCPGLVNMQSQMLEGWCMAVCLRMIAQDASCIPSGLDGHRTTALYQQRSQHRRWFYSSFQQQLPTAAIAEITAINSRCLWRRVLSEDVILKQWPTSFVWQIAVIHTGVEGLKKDWLHTEAGCIL